jgi:RimJ/RimL family protein N-acetyltransferase
LRLIFEKTTRSGALIVIDWRSYNAVDMLKDGSSVAVRTILAGDREAIADAFASLDRESVYTRFFTYRKELPEEELRRLTEVDFEHVVALVVTEQAVGSERLLGGGRYCSEQPLLAARSAELAFVTADEHHGRGIASLILKHLVLIARDQGLAELEADVLADNQPMLAVFRRSGLAMTLQRQSSVVHVRLAI